MGVGGQDWHLKLDISKVMLGTQQNIFYILYDFQNVIDHKHEDKKICSYSVWCAMMSQRQHTTYRFSVQNRTPRDACRLEKCPSYVWFALMSCWRVPKNSRDGEAAVSDWAVERSCSPPTVLMGNDWLTTQLHAHWLRMSTDTFYLYSKN